MPMKETQIDTIQPGDRVSWLSNITGERRFGTVTYLGDEHYHVRTHYRIVLTIHRSRITKECG
jgi:hypothetical protein